MAYCIIADIPRYIQNHLDEYRDFCAKYGYTDDMILKNNSEADYGKQAG